MTTLCFDQSTRISGYSIFEDGKYISSGVIDLHKIKDTTERSKKMGIELCNKIDEVKPSMIVIENVQNQSNIDTVIKLARLQGMIIGYAAAHGIESHVLEPSRWRKELNFKQGRGVERAELKAQSRDYVKKLGLDIESEDECEAVCINVAAQSIFSEI